jgi:hypothetical protein
VQVRDAFEVVDVSRFVDHLGSLTPDIDEMQEVPGFSDAFELLVRSNNFEVGILPLPTTAQLITLNELIALRIKGQLLIAPGEEHAA